MCKLSGTTYQKTLEILTDLPEAVWPTNDWDCSQTCPCARLVGKTYEHPEELEWRKCTKSATYTKEFCELLATAILKHHKMI